MAFYTFRQNNSFGEFVSIPEKGIDQLVFVEANNADDANDKALQIGLYFNGCENGKDCPCCGDRWSMCDEWERQEQPRYYSLDVLFHKPGGYFKPAYVHYSDGTIRQAFAK